MAFKFRLETLLRLRERHLELMEAELARLLKELANAREAHDNKLDEVRQTDMELQEALRQGVTAERYQQMFQYLERIKGELSRLEQRVENLENQVHTARLRVAERHREKELVERLKQREYAAYRAEEQRQAQIEADDLSSMRFGRQKYEMDLV